MLFWHRESSRHRLLLVAVWRSMRFEVEQLAQARWYVRMRSGGQVWAIGSVDGYASLHDATRAAQADAVERSRTPG
jgi:hypothetical protein